MDKRKCGKAAGVDGITAKLLEYDGETEWKYVILHGGRK